jgi:hypothetical protein
LGRARRNRRQAWASDITVVWHSLDAGLNWEPESDREDALAIGAIALDECAASGCGAVFAGTGENPIGIDREAADSIEGRQERGHGRSFHSRRSSST